MGTINKLKYKQAILYFANLIPPVEQGKVKLYKLLYFLDFDHYHRHGESITGDTYRKLPMGPAPQHFDGVVEQMEKHGLVARGELKLREGYKPLQVIRPLKSYDISAFTDEERDSLKRAFEEYGACSGRILAALSHDDPPWMLARMGDELKYEDTWYRYDPELDDSPDLVAEALAESGILAELEKRFG